MDPGRPAPTDAGSVELSVVVPSYNEAQRLPSTLVNTTAYLRDEFADFEVIVADDGSTDGTADIVSDGADTWPEARVVRGDVNRGKGHAVKMGVAHSRGKRVLFVDADGSTPISELPSLTAALDGGADIAIGSRAVRGAGAALETPRHRQIMGRAFAFVVSILVLPDVRDTQCGFKLFTSPSAAALFSRQRMDGFSFDVELLVIARRLGLRVDEVPVDWFNTDGSKVNVLSDSVRMLGDLWQIRGFDRAGAYVEGNGAASAGDASD
ncbi:MAG: dolichyl-phosphate beta-glucosyltransferase [Acidimicrobiales bacterium]